MKPERKHRTIFCGDCGIEIVANASRKLYCDICRKARDRERYRLNAEKRRKEKPDKVKAINKRHYDAHQAYYVQRSVRYGQEHPGWKKAKDKKFHANHPGYKNQANREYYDRLTPEQKERRNEQSRENYAKNPEYRVKKRRNLVNYRARLAGAPGNWTQEQFLALCEELAWCCHYCGQECDKLTVDHALPLSRGGSNGIENIVPACGSCNYSKRDKTEEEFFLYLKTRRTSA